MKFPLLRHRTARVKKKLYHELDPRRYWVVLLSIFVLLFAAELAYFSSLFLRKSKEFDAPATARLETNAGKIGVMKTSIETVERALFERTGEPVSSQNTGEVVQ